MVDETKKEGGERKGNRNSLKVAAQVISRLILKDDRA